MRLLKLGNYYPAYVSGFYAARPKLRNQAYSVQHNSLIEDCFGSADFWTGALKKLNYETLDVIANAEFLQKKWAKENDEKFDENDWLFEIAAAQIKVFRPDVLLVFDYLSFTPEFLRKIRRECSSIKLILGWCGAPYQNLSVIREWDIALSCIPEMVAEFRRAGIRSEHINHAFAPRILEKLDLNSEPNINFSFIGSIVKVDQFHLVRERLLIDLVGHANLQIWSDIRKPTFDEKRQLFIRREAYKTVSAARRAGVSEKVLKALPLVRKVANWDSPPTLGQYIDERLARRTHKPLFGIEMFQKLRDSRIVFNNHIDISPVSASNMRLFEATGVGACLLTDWKENLADLFESEREVVTYRTAEECAEKVNYLLAHEDERRKIAVAGQLRTLREHTFENRAARIDEIIRGFLGSID